MIILVENPKQDIKATLSPSDCFLHVTASACQSVPGHHPRRAFKPHGIWKVGTIISFLGKGCRGLHVFLQELGSEPTRLVNSGAQVFLQPRRGATGVFPGHLLFLPPHLLPPSAGEGLAVPERQSLGPLGWRHVSPPVLSSIIHTHTFPSVDIKRTNYFLKF